MAEWNKQKVLPENINNGNEFTTDDNLAINELNAIVNNSFYSAELSESANIKSDEALFKANQSYSSIGSNPNLLINGDFRVNQRGQTSYTSGYGVDRWRVSGVLQTINNDGTLTISDFGGWNYFEQKIEDFEKLKGKTVTLSVKIKSISYTSGVPKLVIADGVNNLTSDTIPNGFSGIVTLTKTINSNATMVAIRPIENWQSGSVTDLSVIVEYAKLEIGSVATAFSPRPYAEELAMCQRYYQFLSNPNCIGRTNYSDDTAGLLFVPIPVTMRPKYSITTSTNPVCYGNGKSTTASGITFSAQRENGFKMNITLPTGLGVRQVLQAEGVDYTIDAEIY